MLLERSASPRVIFQNTAAKWLIGSYFQNEDDLPDELLCEIAEKLETSAFFEGTFNELHYRASILPDDQRMIRLWFMLPGAGFPARQALLLYERNIAGIYESSIDGGLHSFNEAFCEILGYSKEELLLKDGASIYFRPKGRDAFIAAIRREGYLINHEVCYRHKDGSEICCLENAFMVEDQKQKRIVGTVVDITEQRRIKLRYESLFVSSADAILLLNKGVIVEVNKRAEQIFGVSSGELCGRDVLNADKGIFDFEEKERDLLEMKLNRINEGEKERAQLKSKRKDGSKFFSEVHFTRIGDGAEGSVQMIVRDISDRVLYEEAIRESEERFKLLSEVALEGVVFEANGKIQDCNRQFGEQFGYSNHTELTGRNLSDFISEQDYRRLEKTLDIRSVNRIEIRTHTHAGEPMVLEATGSQIEYQGRQQRVFLFYDITSRKRTEQALEQSTERFRSVVEYSPNGIFIITDGKVRYTNQAGLSLLELDDEDEIYGCVFEELFEEHDLAALAIHLERVRNGEEVDYAEYRLETASGEKLSVGLKATLSVYDNRPSIQITLNNLSTRMKLVQETLRAQIAEEINVVLKKEIEEHKRTQQKLREAEGHLRNLVQSSIDMIIAVDQNDLITEFNASAEQHFGYTADEIIGKPSKMLYADEEVFTKVRQSIVNEHFYSGEVISVSKSGKKFTSLMSANVLRDDDDEIIGAMAVARDVTELKRKEAEIRASEERYRDLFENASDLIFSIRPDGSFQYANNAFHEALGYSKKALRTLKFHDITDHDELCDSKNLLNDFAGKVKELNLIAKDGKLIRVFGDSSIRYKNSKPYTIRAIYRDITDLKMHEQAALEQGAKLESIFNSTENMMMWTLDMNGKLTSCNHNFERWVERELGAYEHRAANFLEVLHSKVNLNAYQKQLDAFDEAFKGRAQQFELPLINTHSEENWLQVFVNPVRIQEIQEEVSVIAYDITDRKEIDRKILDSLKEKEVLLQEVHHRVKNNLQVISSILNLQSSFVDDQRTLELLEESQSRIKTMSYIHETLYQTADFSSIEFTDYISTLVRNLLHSYSTPGCEVELHTRFDKIYLDLDKAIPCGLIINELVSNALKYAFKGRDRGNLTLHIFQNDNKIAMKVADDGVGLPDDFKYEESESLGIYLVYALVEQLDAVLEISSEGGTSFLITFDKD